MSDRPRWTRKRIRLQPEAYAQAGAVCSVTIAVEGRRPRFADAAAAAAAIQVLKQHASRTGVLVYAYCIMPDHVHLLLGPSETCDLVQFVGQFKNLAQRAIWRQGVRGRIWQLSFWDRFLRSDEDLRQAVEYVLHNPVVAGLVEHWRDYPFAGSLVFAVRE